MPSRTHLIAGVLFLAGSLSAGVASCREKSESEAPSETGHTQWQSSAVREADGNVTPLAVPAAARCAVCGMYPARFQRWAAQLVLRDGSRRWFDSPHELLVFLRETDRYGKGVKSEDIIAEFVSDFDGGGWVRATDAFFIRGSRQQGPMGSDAFPAFEKRTAAAAWVAAQGGEILDWKTLIRVFSETEHRNKSEHPNGSESESNTLKHHRAH